MKFKCKIFILAKSILLCIALSFLLSFNRHQDPLARIIVGFEKYLKELPQEKVYLHFDRSYYSAGETIWFKAYLTEGAYHEASSLSRTIYVELINQRSELVQKLNILSSNGSASGSFLLNDSLMSGTYLVRAYTNWMKNSGEEYFFHHSIKIRHPKSSIEKVSNENGFDIQFFPEGGNLVNGIFSKVAFKAIGQDGLGRRVRGRIFDGSKTVGEFESNSLGMGVFSLMPVAGKQYKAIIENFEGEVSLPQAQVSGLVMSVNTTPKSTDILVRIQTSDFTTPENTIYIIAQTRGVICYSAKAHLTTNVTLAKIPKTAFLPGIVQITVTDNNGVPLSERLIFVDNEDRALITVRPNKMKYKPREFVKLDILVSDHNGTPVEADLSLSVYDSNQIIFDENSESIRSYLLLSSEIKGFLESPGYYFNPQNKDREEALDYLLLTQGWRRVTLREIIDQNWLQPLHKPEQGLSIKGKMIDAHRDKPIINGKVSCLSIYPRTEIKSVITDSKGEFEINNIIYFDSTNAMIQGETKRGNKSVKIIVNNSYDIPPLKFPKFLSIMHEDEIEKRFMSKSIERGEIDKAFDFDEKTIVLNEVEVHGRKADSQSVGSKTFGFGTTSIKVSDNAALENLVHPLQLIQGRVAGVQVTGSDQNWSILIQGVGSINSGTSPLIMIDDIPTQIESLNTIPVQIIDSYTIWKGADAAIFGARGANGVIGFYTRKKVNSSNSSGGSSITYAKAGFQIERQFYSPKYDVQKQEHIKPDKRITLFWAPYIKTDSSGRATVTFYNHDEATSITGTLEGLTPTGSTLSTNFIYEIEGN